MDLTSHELPSLIERSSLPLTNNLLFEDGAIGRGFCYTSVWGHKRNGLDTVSETPFTVFTYRGVRVCFREVVRANELQILIYNVVCRRSLI